MSVKERVSKRKRERVMRSAALTDKVIAFSRTLRLWGKKERRKDTQEEEARRRQKEIKTFSEREWRRRADEKTPFSLLP